MPINIMTRGPQSGTCNVCGEFGKLTDDHTPPKGCLRPTQVEIRHISSHLSSGPPTSKARLSQNGVKYKTVCARCNNTLLGAKYDPHLIGFVNEIGSFLKSSLYLPHQLAFPGRPQAILRSLLGHMSAQGVDRYRKGPLTEKIRDFILDPSLPFPEELTAFYWAYPFQSHVMIRDAALSSLLVNTEPFTFWLLKFFPVAFMIAWDKPSGLEHNPHSFDQWRHCAYDDVVQMPFRLRPLLPAYWPEAPTDHSFVLYGQEAIHVKG